MEHLGYLAFLAPLALFWGQARAFFKSSISFLIRNDEIDSSTSHLLSYLRKNSKEIKFGNVTYFGSWVYPKKYKESLITFFLFRKRYIFLYKNWIPIIVSPKGYNRGGITYFNIINFEKIISDFTFSNYEYLLNDNKKNKRFQVYNIRGKSLKKLKSVNISSSESSTSGQISKSESDSSQGLSTINFDFLDNTPVIGMDNNEVMSSLSITAQSKYYLSKEGKYVLNQVDNWIKSKDWYHDRQIRWYRGVLLYGKPGTGKSALILEIAKILKITVYIFDLSSMDNEEFIEKLSDVDFGSIVLIEDIDCSFNGRESLTKTDQYGGLSFDCLINKLSGVDAIKNCFLFISTNHIDKVDPALMRDGRIDEVIEIGYLSQEGKRFIASRMLDLWPELIDEVVTDMPETAAEFENKCTKLSLEKYWSK